MSLKAFPATTYVDAHQPRFPKRTLTLLPQAVVETQIRHHGFELEDAIVHVEPEGQDGIMTTEHIKDVITQHASTTAILLLPGVHYYTGQFLDMRAITAHARALGIFVIWDVAHAVGNVPLSLHEWDVDAAVWCSYKYLSAGPGCIAGLYIHERHTRVGNNGSDTTTDWLNRFAGWWGNNKSTRFDMVPKFYPVPGAAGFQLSNPSVLDMTSLCSALEVFELAGGMQPIRLKSINMSRFIIAQLDSMPHDLRGLWRIISPREDHGKGAQISIHIEGEHVLSLVLQETKAAGILLEYRPPSLLRVAPGPLYVSFEDCWTFTQAFQRGLEQARVSSIPIHVKTESK